MKHRLTLFSDAVYAIIITLMVLDLRTPEVPGWGGWWHLLPAACGYLATFALLLACSTKPSSPYFPPPP